MQLIRCWLLGLAIAGVPANPVWAFTREVYLWQRQFSPAVYAALEAVRSDVDGCAVLAAEVSWEKAGLRLFRSSVNYAALAITGRPIGLVLRIGPYTGSFTSDDEAARYLRKIVIAMLADARAGGLEPAELQIDFDCASSRLAGYRLWLEMLRAVAPATKFTFTALPDWLGRADFPALAHVADGYILQVHSLEKPSNPDAVFQLCDPDRAWAWIVLAERIGVPFRVALPTYGYRLAFDATGKFIGLSAEGVSPILPANGQLRTVRTDASTMAALANKLARARPINCTGIIWFRLPVAGDRLNWDMTTFKVVLRGEIPASDLVTEVVWPSEGLAEVRLINRGERDEFLPAVVFAKWKDEARAQTADGLGGYSFSTDEASPGVIALTASAAAAGQRLAPGRSRTIGWIRFSHEISLIAQITTPP